MLGSMRSGGSRRLVRMRRGKSVELVIDLLAYKIEIKGNFEAKSSIPEQGEAMGGWQIGKESSGSFGSLFSQIRNGRR